MKKLSWRILLVVIAAILFAAGLAFTNINHGILFAGLAIPVAIAIIWPETK